MTAKKNFTSREIAEIATNAANGNETIGRLIAEAYDKVGLKGVITVEEPETVHSTVDVVHGTQFDRGYLSQEFVTDEARMECVFHNTYILLCDETISFERQLRPLYEQLIQQTRPLLIIATDVNGEALAALVRIKQKGSLHVCAVKSPSFGQLRKARLDDIAILTSGAIATPELGLPVEGVTLEDLGRARRVVITKDNTTIVEGAGQDAEIEVRIKQIRLQIEETPSDIEREMLEERLAKLANNVAVIRVGASTEAEMIEKKELTEHALRETRAAIEEGIIPSGGRSSRR